MKHKKCPTGKFILLKTFLLGYSIPYLIVLVTSFSGKDIKSAMNVSMKYITLSDKSIGIWGVCLIAAIAGVIYFKPVQMYYVKYLSGAKISDCLWKSACRRINNLEIFIILLSFSGFFTGMLLNFISNPHSNPEMKNVFFGIVDQMLTAGLTSILLILSLYNITASARVVLRLEESGIKRRFISYQAKFSYVFFVIVLFLFFQMFASVTFFTEVGARIAINAFENGEMVQLSDHKKYKNYFEDYIEKHEDIHNLFKVFMAKTIVFLLYIYITMVLFKKMLRQQIYTAKDSLVDLNSGKLDLDKHIDIVFNDEFGQIYREINKLIDKQKDELSHSQKRFFDVVENAADSIILFDRNGKIILFNPAAEKLFGWEQTDILGKNFCCCVSDFDLNNNINSENESSLSHKCNIGEQIFDDPDSAIKLLKRFTGQTKSGEKLILESNISRSFFNNEVTYTTIIRDITKQVEIENNLKKAKEDAENASRMKSEFLANMSHELRTPLNAVLGFTQLLQNDKNLTDTQVDNIRTISRSGEHLLALINDILDISKIEAGRFEINESIFDIYELVNDLHQMFDLKCRKKNINLYTEVVEGTPRYLNGDLGKLRQVLINMLGNSVKFTDDGGVSLLVGTDEDGIKFSVSDTGKGIREDELETILQPFRQASNTNHEGGTGLAISNSFIRMMGGKLNVESRLGEGTTFTFILDMNESLTPPVDISEGFKNVIGIAGNKIYKILIVDDKINNRLVLKLMLEKIGFVTMEAKDGKEGFERAFEFQPDIIFMDIRMPDMDGYDSVKAIRSKESGYRFKIFALTASAFNHDKDKIISSGFDGFLAKPFRQSELFHLIESAIDIEFIHEETSTAEISPILNEDSLNFKSIAGDMNITDLDLLSNHLLINDFSAMITKAEDIKKQNETLKKFADLIITYAKDFNDDKLQIILNKVREAK